LERGGKMRSNNIGAVHSLKTGQAGLVLFTIYLPTLLCLQVITDLFLPNIKEAIIMGSVLTATFLSITLEILSRLSSTNQFAGQVKKKTIIGETIHDLPKGGFKDCLFKDCNFRVSLDKSSFQGCVFFRCRFRVDFNHVGEDCFFSDCSFAFQVNSSRSHIGDYTCVNNARSPFLRCAIAPDGPCDNCQYFDDGVPF
jgi:hypothetical protein